MGRLFDDDESKFIPGLKQVRNAFDAVSIEAPPLR